MKRLLIWNDEAILAFEGLKVTLKYPDIEKPLVLTTDPSNYSLGGVLQQTDEKKLRPITMFSRKLNATEQKYANIEREALTVIYGA